MFSSPDSPLTLQSVGRHILGFFFKIMRLNVSLLVVAGAAVNGVFSAPVTINDDVRFYLIHTKSHLSICC